MASKQKVQKQKAPKQKVIRYKPNINLLKNINAIFLVAGFMASLLTVVLLSSGDRYDTRSRGQVVTVSPAPSISLSPTPK